MDDKLNPDSMLENEYSDELPTLDDDKPTPEKKTDAPVGIVHRTMLKDPEEERNKFEEPEEKSSIERKTVYDNKEQQEHFFSKTDIKVSEDFEEAMRKKQEWERERREELSKGTTAGSTNDLADQLNQKIAQNIHQKRETDSEEEISIKKGILAAIGAEIVLCFVYIPNQIFILPPIVNVVMTVASVVLVLLSVAILILFGNMAKNHAVPEKLHTLFLSASVLPGAILRVALVVGVAKLCEFIPIAGAYIGCCIGAAIAAAMHYLLLDRYKIRITQLSSFVNTLATITLLVIPNLITGTIDQPMDQKAQFGFYVYLIESVFIVIVDIIIFQIRERRMTKR